jgi:uncharacterized protein YtpQ (UPF0354 family)
MTADPFGGGLAYRICFRWRRNGITSRLCIFLAIFPAYTLVLAQEVPTGEAAFTEYVASQLRRETGGAAVSVKGPLTLALGGVQANLDRIFAFCRSNRSGCSREISNYVTATAQIYNGRSTPPSKEAVRVVVRRQAYVTASQAALPMGAPKLQLRSLAGALVILPAIDTPRTIRMLTEKDMQDLGLSADGAFRLGLANLSHRLKPLMEVAQAVRPGQIGHISGDAYNSSRLAMLESWSPLAKAQDGKLIVAAPATDTVLYIGDETPIAIDALRTLANSISARAPNPLSSELLRWTPRRWEAVR